MVKASVIIVNYNGKSFLDECLSSLRKINFDKKLYEVIIVDNNSEDSSVKYIKEKFSFVKVVESDTNLGFAGGVNLGVKHATGEYIVLLNTDTRVDANWLKPLVDRIESDKNIAAVNSKVLLFYPFIELTIKSDISPLESFNSSMNFLPVGVMIENIILDNQALQLLTRFRSGVYEKKEGSFGNWTNGEAKVLVPINPKQAETGLTLLLRPEKLSSGTNLKISLDDEIIISSKIKAYETKKFRLNLKTSRIKKHFLYAVQNAGVVVFKNGFGRDRGAVVRNNRQFYEIDSPFFDQPSEVQAFSGASVIIRKSVFEALGGFDESFFMYYEDVDLSLKMKRSGYKVYYEPQSVIYHIHSGTSKEWSSFFNYHVEKNHLSILIKHFPLSEFFVGFVRYLARLGIAVLKMSKSRSKRDWSSYSDWKDTTIYRKNVVVWILKNAVSFFRKRMIIDKTSKISIQKIYKNLS